MSTKQYLYRVSILNKKNSHPLESICYYSGENQYDMINSKNYTSNTHENVIWNSIELPNKENNYAKYLNLPEYLKLRSNKKDMMSNARNILWQNVFTREKRDDAQFARLFEVLIPGFMSKIEAISSLKEFSRKLVDDGMIVDCSVHYRQNNLNNTSIIDKIKNPTETEDKSESSIDYTGFLMCTLRDYENGRFVNKNREWNDKRKMESWRATWVEILAKKVAQEPNSEIRNNWEEKLTIYSEYEKIKENFKNEKSKLSI